MSYEVPYSFQLHTISLTSNQPDRTSSLFAIYKMIGTIYMLFIDIVISYALFSKCITQPSCPPI